MSKSKSKRKAARVYSDSDVLTFALKKCGTRTATAEALGVGPRPQTIDNWLKRGISPGWRPAVWVWCRKNGLKLSKDWLIKTMVARERHNPMMDL